MSSGKRLPLGIRLCKDQPLHFADEGFFSFAIGQDRVPGVSDLLFRDAVHGIIKCITAFPCFFQFGKRNDNRKINLAIALYESGYRVPSPKLLKAMAEVLDCNVLALMDGTGQNAEELMMLLFWLEEEHPGMIYGFQMQRMTRKDDDINTYDAANDRNVSQMKGNNAAPDLH